MLNPMKHRIETLVRIWENQLKPMKQNTAATILSKRRLLTALALATFASATAIAQTSVPTPKSVAPDYKPPQTVSPDYSASQKYQYVEPHAGTWDFYLFTGGWFFNNTTMHASHVRIDHDDYISGNIRMDFDDSWALGFGAGYNITDRLSVHGQFAYTSPDYTAVFHADDGRVYDVWGEANISTGDIAIRYDLTKGKFRPFVQASIGFMYMDTGIPNGPYSYWWDWYWGDYYVDSPTVDHTYFTLGATAGLRYDITKNFFAQASYTANWANTPRNWMLNQRVNLGVGWNY